MKAYYITSPRGLVKDKELYHQIYKIIESSGYAHLTDFVLSVEVEEFYLADISKFYAETVKDLKQADVCIFETTTPSLAVGHLISMALQYGKPVIALFTGENTPFFLTGIKDEKIQVINYTRENIKQMLTEALEYAQETVDTRFNFFISPSLSHYLDWIAQTKKIPRSVYLRQLIENDRDTHKEYFDA